MIVSPCFTISLGIAHVYLVWFRFHVGEGYFCCDSHYRFKDLLREAESEDAVVRTGEIRSNRLHLVRPVYLLRPWPFVIRLEKPPNSATVPQVVLAVMPHGRGLGTKDVTAVIVARCRDQLRTSDVFLAKCRVFLVAECRARGVCGGCLTLSATRAKQRT